MGVLQAVVAVAFGHLLMSSGPGSRENGKQRLNDFHPFYLLVPSGTPAHGTVLSTLRAGLPSLRKLLWKRPHRQMQRCIS